MEKRARWKKRQPTSALGKFDVYFEALLLHICMMNCMKIFELRTKCSTMSCERWENRKNSSREFSSRRRQCARVRVSIQCLLCLFIEIETNKDFLEFPLTRCFPFKIFLNFVPTPPKTCRANETNFFCVQFIWTCLQFLIWSQTLVLLMSWEVVWVCLMS